MALITLDTLQTWLEVPVEDEHLEFKEAKRQFDHTKLLEYCVALANEGGGKLILGVKDKRPREVVGSQAFKTPEALNSIKSQIVEKLRIRVETIELNHADGRVLVFDIPSRPIGQPINFEGAYLMRAGESLVPMTPDKLKRIFSEDNQDWFLQSAKENLTLEEIINLLDTQVYFELMDIPYPTNWNNLLNKLASDQIIHKTSQGWSITNLGAILFAKELQRFSSNLARKAPRFILYEGVNKLKTRNEVIGKRGYAAGFNGLVRYVHDLAPRNEFIEEVIRKEVKMFPIRALRELIANALIHQDFQAEGTSVMIEMYDDRVEISNPGLPKIKIERFIDEYRSRNEKLANLMRRLRLCEEKGSGIDKVIYDSELYQLPAPDFRVGETRTTAILYAHQDFIEMSQSDKVRACYQHCCLRYLSNQKMSNKTLRERFHLDQSEISKVSTIIRKTKKAGLIKKDTTGSESTRYAQYIPFWA